MEYRIVNAELRHIEQLEQIEQACFSMPWTKEQLKGQMPDSCHVFIAAESGEAVLGYVGMMYIIDEGYISNVAIAPEYRRQGIADALIDELMGRAAALNLAFVTLEARQSNSPAIALYKKHGFVPVGVRKNYYELPKEDAVLMTKFLK